ncbi:MAG: ABC transporter ATP-binding protein [Marinobacter sp.]|uniref:ABC transporter ATP-binding protein n=1 Tax=Marinobacter sp. TaxID=50741 RepID=UPI00299E2E4E|nr:ABC transporter ATP-binding protein [Marinobacter sp.]MDX1756488.1 ABC transporter ATP-binding protein [Marinobacter sp.]
MRLSAQQICVDYGKSRVLDDLSLTLSEGAITCLLGPNGSGKSTLLKALAGSLQPVSGQVVLGDRALAQWPGKALARQLALLPQHPVAPEGLLVGELVHYGRSPHQGFWGARSREDDEIVAWALAATGLAAYGSRRLSQLSGGERQRVWIALALAQQAPILLLDEPTTFLDLGHQLEVMELLTDLNREHGLTVVMSLHDINQAARYAHQLVVMERGRIVAHGEPASTLTEDLLARVFRVRGQVESDPLSRHLSCRFHSSLNYRFANDNG